MTQPRPPDFEALLVALVLSPATYSRNRFFAMYSDPAVRRVRRRASLVRSIIAQIANPEALRRADISVEPWGDGHLRLSYVVPSVGMRRTARLDPLEMALVRYSIARSLERAGASMPPKDDPDRARIEAALRRLAPDVSGEREPAP